MKKQKQLLLDVTAPNKEGNYYLINKKNKLVGEISSPTYLKNSESYLLNTTGEEVITPITQTGWRKKKSKKPKTKRKSKKGCGCK